jgi:hypothetical protein
MPKLTCGGKGPCCHVGYAHRHCEHCDVVIDTRQPWQWMPPIYPTTVRPYITWGNTGTGIPLPPNPTVYAMNSAEPSSTEALAHTCEVTN